MHQPVYFHMESCCTFLQSILCTKPLELIQPDNQLRLHKLAWCSNGAGMLILSGRELLQSSSIWTGWQFIFAIPCGQITPKGCADLSLWQCRHPKPTTTVHEVPKKAMAHLKSPCWNRLGREWRAMRQSRGCSSSCSFGLDPVIISFVETEGAG